MRDDKYKQMYCVCEKTSSMFEMKMNAILKAVKNPEIEIDRTRPFTAYVFYNVVLDVPETIPEAFQLLEGISHTCQECSYLIKSPDKRKRWQQCGFFNKRIHQEQPVCEVFYKEKVQKNLPGV